MESLWGLRFVDSQYLADGRADTIEEVIEMYAIDLDSTARGAGPDEAFGALSDGDKTWLLNFLNAL
jgi:hypothetical protein